ncbi:serine/threonine protein kinase, partial [Gamsiella multidivaricata]
MGSSTTVIGGEYLVLGKIGEGSFGEVFRATHIASGVDYAIKREPIDVPHPQLEHEAKVYGILAGGDGIPKLRWFGKEGVYNAMVIDLLGPNLKQVRRENEKFPLSFVIEISHLRFIHSRGLVYRDVKPENFLLDVDITLPDAPLGKDIHAHTPPTSLDQTMSFFNDTRKRQQSLDSNMSTSPGSPILAAYGKPHLSIVDFGLASHYRDASGKHIPNRGSTKHKVGTARYASINIHCGREHTRRDDIESVGYMLLELMIGTLPWSGISARNSRQGWAKMREIKEDIDLDELCEGLPRGFMTYIGYTRSLRFDEEPDYEYLQNLLRSCAGRGAEAQTVRCHRDPPRSLENTFGGVPIHRGGAYGKGDDPFKSRDRCKPENPLKDWRRNRPQYSPPKSDHREYSPTSLWTTTPPDAAAKKELFPKEKIEWENTDPYPDMGTDKSCSLWGEENQDAGSKNRKCSWGEDDPNARWGDESPKTTLKNRKLSWGEDDPNSRWGDEEDDDDGVSFPPFQIESFQDEVTPTIHDNKHSNGQSKAPVSSTQGLGRQFAPQDARFYLSDPPAGLKPRLGNGSGFHQTNGTPTPPSKGRQQQQQQQQQQHGQGHVYHMHAPPVHPLARDLSSLAAAQPPLPPLSPKSLSASLSSLHIRAGTHEEPGIERSQVAANRGSLSEIGSLPAKPTSSGRKTSNPQDRVRGRTDAMGTGTTTTSTNTNASAAAWDRDSGRNYGNN